MIKYTNDEGQEGFVPVDNVAFIAPVKEVEGITVAEDLRVKSQIHLIKGDIRSVFATETPWTLHHDSRSDRI